MKTLGPRVGALSLCTVLSLAAEQGGATEPQSQCVIPEAYRSLLNAGSSSPVLRSFSPSEIVSCRLLPNDGLLLFYRNGDLMALGIGDRQLNSGAGVPVAPSAARLDAEVDSHAGTQEEHRLFIELERIWTASSPTAPTSEELLRSDILVRKIFATTRSEVVQLADYEFLGARGNRYRSFVEGLSDLPPAAAVAFYGSYLDSQQPSSGPEDSPSDAEKHGAITNLVAIFETTEVRTQFCLNFNSSQELRRLDLGAYERLKALGVVTEDPS